MTSVAPDTVFVGGAVWLHGLPREAAPTALAVAGGRIVALGDEAARLAPSAAEVVDLEGGALLPAFGDGHAHPVFAGLDDFLADVRDKPTLEETLAGVARWAAEHPEAPWVRGDGYDPTLAPGGVFLASWLDEVVPDRPVWLRASDYHTAWVNSVALERAGIRASTADPPDGEIVRDADGRPSGTLREWGAWRLVEAVAPPLPGSLLTASLLTATARFASLGVTWVQDAWAEAEAVDAWLGAAASGRLTVRGNLALLASPASWRDDLDALVATRERVAAEGAGLVTARTVKFFADGVIEAGTGALLEPYVDCGHSHGLPNWDWAELAEAVAAVDALGFQVHLHAIGDAAVRAALDAVAVAGERNGPRDRRAVVAHAQLVQPVDRPRFAELDVVANFEPLWICRDANVTELTLPRLGEPRGSWQYPVATLAASGRVSFGSDWPVSSPDPRLGLAVAVTHEVPPYDGGAWPPGEPWLPEERLSLEDAVAAYTSGVAYQAGEEDRWGSIAVGHDADLVHLAVDPRTVDVRELPQVAVRGTWRSGSRVF